MSVMIGSARISENGSVNGIAGDQKQTSSNDTTGEVSQQKFYVHSKGWNLLRAKDKNIAQRLSLSMRTACNNPNIGYSQGDRYGVVKHGTSAQIPCNADCSSLVRRCVLEASGTDPGDFNTGNEVSILMKTGLFDKLTYVKGMDLHEGDILVTQSKGHTAIVTSTSDAPDGILKKGSTGDDVKWVQQKLTDAGYDLSKHGGIDGEFGDFTDQCVREFQKKNGLEVDGEVGPLTKTALSKVEKKQSAMRFGVDVAKWQGMIDWNQVKASGNGDFAVLKVTKKNNQIEDSFERNYAGTKAAAIPIAVYRYVYAKSVGQAVEEANGILAALNGKAIEGIVWLDMEDSSIRNIGKAALTLIIDTEADALKARGYEVGIYCNRDWYEKVLDGAGLSARYKFWIAKYGKNTGNGSWQNRADDPKDIAVAWQYTSKGRVPGISGDVDLDIIY